MPVPADDANYFMATATQIFQPLLESRLGPMPPYTLAPYQPPRPRDDPDQNLNGLSTGFNAAQRTLSIFYHPQRVGMQLHQGKFFFANMVIHDLLHLYQIDPLARCLGWTWESMLAYQQGTYDPSDPSRDYVYWLEGAAMLIEQMIVIELIEDRGRPMDAALNQLFGSSVDMEEALWGPDGVATRVFQKLASTLILASRVAGSIRPDFGLLSLPFELPVWLCDLRSLPPFDDAFRERELPYYVGGHHCGRLLARGVTPAELLRTPIAQSQLLAA